jgi:hypothetical protein
VLKRIGCLLVVLILLFALAWYKPWRMTGLTFGSLIGLEEIKSQSGLAVFSLKDQIEVFVDNQYKDKIEAGGGSIEVGELEPGIHRVTLRKVTDGDAEYYEFSKSLNFEAGVSNVVAYELGPSSDFSQGHVFYTEKSEEKNENGKTLISFHSKLDEVEVYMDNKLIGKTPLENYEISLDKQYDITLKKSGFEELNFKILPESEADRTKLEGLNLFIEADLFLKPIDIKKNG